MLLAQTFWSGDKISIYIIDYFRSIYCLYLINKILKTEHDLLLCQKKVGNFIFIFFLLVAKSEILSIIIASYDDDHHHHKPLFVPRFFIESGEIIILKYPGSAMASPDISLKNCHIRRFI